MEESLEPLEDSAPPRPEASNVKDPEPKELPGASPSSFLVWAFVAVGAWAGLGFYGPGFDSAEALFTGLAFAGVIVTVMLQSQQIREQTKQLNKQKREALDSAYGARVDTLVNHYRMFFDIACVKSRRLAWPSIQKTYFDEAFRLSVASFSHVPKRGTRDLGNFLIREHSEDGAFSWHHAVHQIDESLAYFSIFAMRIRSVELVLKDLGARREEFEGLVRRMNVYWPWWGPALRYIVRLRQEHADDTHDAIYGSLNFLPDFDLLDRYLLKSTNGGAAASTDGSTGAVMLEELYFQDPRWLELDKTAPKVARDPMGFTIERTLGIKTWRRGT